MNALTFEVRVTDDHLMHLPKELPTGTLVRVQIEAIDAVDGDCQPCTEIGRLALAARKAYIKGGGKLLNIDQISEEVRHRRGGLHDD